MRNFLPIIIFFFCTGLTQAQLFITASPVSGCDSLTVQFGLLPEAGTDTIHSIIWDFGNNSSITGTLSPMAVYSEPGSYTVSSLINNVTTLTFANPIIVRAGPRAIFSHSDTISLDPLSKFFSVVPQPVSANTYSYMWEFSDGPEFFTSSFMRAFDETGIYTVSLSITDQTGCSDQATTRIVVGDLIEVPNVFSPNGDDINDYLLIRTNGINLFSMEIYTRSGLMVYKTESPYLVWDGRSTSGNEMSPGIYYYIIKQIDSDADLEKRGFVHLIR